MPGYNPGGSTGGLFGGNLGGLMGSTAELFKGGGGGFLESLKKMFQGDNGAFSNIMDSLAFGGNLYGMNRAFGIQDDKMDIMNAQEGRAKRADDTNFANQQFMADQLIGQLANNQVPQNQSLAGIPPGTNLS